jgi:hypothetical protein
LNRLDPADSEAFRAAVRAAIDATPAPARLREHDAVVLERIALGAGMTCWFDLDDVADLDRLVSRLRPASLVSFYFAGQIADTVYDGTVPRLDGAMAATGPEVAGVLAPDGFAIDCDFPTGLEEFREFLSQVAVGARLFYGAFPGRDNDGVSAVTLRVPDLPGAERKRYAY